MNSARSRKIVVAGAGFGVVALTLGVFAATLFSGGDIETQTLDDRLRAGQPGRFARLTDGVTHFEVQGPETGPAVVLIHGLTSPYFVWDETARFLARNGFRVLRYDLFGRGLSDRPGEAAYDLEFYLRQLNDLLSVVGIRDQVSVIGLSMGALIAAHFADRHAHRVSKLSLVGPAGFAVPPATNLLVAATRIPAFGETFARLIWPRFVQDAPAKLFADPAAVTRLRPVFEPQTRIQGYRRAILRSTRNMPLADFRETHARVGTHPRPVLILWGDHDDVTPLDPGLERAKAAYPRAKIAVIAGAGHVAPFEAPEKANQAILDFLKSKPDPDPN